MKAIFWKEIRENLKWGVIGFVGFALALALAWSKVKDPQRGSDYDSILSSVVLMATTLCAPAIGAALGFLQIMPEQRRDRWAFLVHRPVSWATIFQGKAAAGLTLYFAATLVPWIFLCFWASIPGHVTGPFNWGMSLGGLSDILSGAAFYFAGMIASLRQARWLGSKALALTGAVWALLMAAEAVHFWAALAWIATMTAVLAISAQGNFVKNGVYTSQNAIARLALIAAYVFGIHLLLAWGFGFARGMVPAASGSGSGSYYGITKDGEAVRIFFTRLVNTRVEYNDGTVLPLTKEQLAGYGSESEWSSLEPEDGYDLLPYRDLDSYFIPVARSSRRMGNRWFYNRATRKLETYDSFNRRLIAYITPDGYHQVSEGAPASVFPEGFKISRNGDLMTFDTGYYLIDFVELNARLIKERQNTADDKGVAYLPANEEPDAPVSKSLVAVGQKEGIAFYKGSDGSLQCMVPYEKDTKAWPEIWPGRTADGLHLFVWYLADHETRKASGFKIPLLVYRYSMNGTFEKKWELPSILQPEPGPPWTSYLWESGTPLELDIYSAARIWIGKKFGDSASIQLWNDRFINNWPEERINWLVSALTGLVCALLAIPLCKSCRLTVRESAGWFVFVFFSSIAGLLVFLAVKEWPVRIACSKCAKQRAIEDDSCEHCAAPWDAPKRDGTEIFA